MSPPRVIGVIGASSPLGHCILQLLALAGHRVLAFSRSSVNVPSSGSIRWLPLTPELLQCPEVREISHWIYLAPIWTLDEHLPLIELTQSQKIVAMSSTSIYTKKSEKDVAPASEIAIVKNLQRGEARLKNWCEEKGIQWVLLRPTLVFGLGRDGNIAEIMRFISKFHWFPILGQGNGLRQPVHVNDLAKTILGALNCETKLNRAFNVAGGEVLAYREMVRRIFELLHLPPRIIQVPVIAFKAAFLLLNLHPRYRNWTVAMALRMNKDMVFDSTDAIAVLGHNPRKFVLTPTDLPQQLDSKLGPR